MLSFCRGLVAATLTVLALLASAAPSSAARAATPAHAAQVAPGADVLPHRLPPAGARAAATVSGRWLVGAAPGRASADIARRFGARPVGRWGAWVVRTGRARALVAALRSAGAYRYAEPDRRSAVRAAPDPLTAQAGWRAAVVRADLVAPPVGPTSPLLAFIDSQLDTSHPEFRGSATTSSGTGAVVNEHGTATAGLAGAPTNGIGIEGIWPGARVANLPTTLTCSDVVARIDEAVRLGAAVLNMSYGSDVPCRAEYVALQGATARGVLLVAAAGNEFAEGNPLEFPASLPHVFTVAAASEDRDGSAYFSNANAAIDLSAPGVGLLTTVPPGMDGDGPADGYARHTGTSFAAPIVTGVAGWIRAARPELDAYQVQQVLRSTADDMASRGWDVRTGWGFVDLAEALGRPAPPADPAEPNDGISFVSGEAFGIPSAAILRSTQRRARLTAAVDVFEDPHDVYRVVLPARGSARITVQPRFGDPDLRVFDRRARTVDLDLDDDMSAAQVRARKRRRHVLAESERSGRRRDSVVLVNRRSRSRSFFVDVFTAERGRTLNAGYRLAVTRR